MIRPSRLRSHALLTDEPGVVVHNPRRQLARLLVLYAVLPLICAGAATFIAFQLAAVQIDQRVDRLEADLAQRRAGRAAEDRVRDERLTQTRRDLCVVLDRLIPRDPPVEDLRRRYGCTGALPLSPSSSPSPRTPPPSGGGTSGGGRNATTGSGGAAAPRPAPTPGPPGPPGPTGPAGPPATPPSPPPTNPGGDGLVCLPLIGCVL